MGRRRSRINWVAVHAKERDEVSQKYGGLDAKIIHYFLHLPDQTLEAVFIRYTAKHGESAGRYARKAYEGWRGNYIKMSGQTLERLLDAVPPCLDISAKISLVELLWDKPTIFQKIQLDFKDQALIGDICNRVERLILAESARAIPDAMRARLSWLAENDSVYAEAIVQRVRFAKASALIQNLRGRLGLAAIQQADNRVKLFAHIHIRFAELSIQITVDGFLKDDGMIQNPENLPQKVTPPLSANNLFESAFNQLDEDQQKRAKESVMQKVIELKSLEANQKLHLDSARGKIDAALSSVRSVDDGVSAQATATERDNFGEITITLKKKDRMDRTVMIIIAIAVAIGGVVLLVHLLK